MLIKKPSKFFDNSQPKLFQIPTQFFFKVLLAYLSLYELSKKLEYEFSHYLLTFIKKIQIVFGVVFSNRSEKRKTHKKLGPGTYIHFCNLSTKIQVIIWVLKCNFTKIYIYWPQKNPLVLCWQLLYLSIGHAKHRCPAPPSAWCGLVKWILHEWKRIQIYK